MAIDYRTPSWLMYKPSGFMASSAKAKSPHIPLTQFLARAPYKAGFSAPGAPFSTYTFFNPPNRVGIKYNNLRGMAAGKNVPDLSFPVKSPPHV
jgi:hypothetical protein